MTKNLQFSLVQGPESPEKRLVQGPERPKKHGDLFSSHMG